MRESAVTSHFRLDAALMDVPLLRNNSGAFKNETGRLVRFGLGSFSEKDEMKSPDWIGITPVFITEKHLGTVLGVFTGLEAKSSDWVFYQSDKTALHQQNFHDMVKRYGGYSGFVTCKQDFRRIIGREEQEE